MKKFSRIVTYCLVLALVLIAQFETSRRNVQLSKTPASLPVVSPEALPPQQEPVPASNGG